MMESSGNYFRIIGSHSHAACSAVGLLLAQTLAAAHSKSGCLWTKARSARRIDVAKEDDRQRVAGSVPPLFLEITISFGGMRALDLKIG